MASLTTDSSTKYPFLIVAYSLYNQLNSNFSKSTEGFSPMAEQSNNISYTDLSLIIQELQAELEELKRENEMLRGAKKDLEASRIKYFNLYHLAPVGYFTFDMNSEILEVNLAAADLLGMIRILLLGNPFMSYLTADSQHIWQKHVENITKRPHDVHRCELDIKKANKSIVPVQVESRAVMGMERRPSHFRTALLDISRRKEAEQQSNELHLKLQQSEQQFRMSLEKAHISVFTQNTDLVYTWMYNPYPKFPEYNTDNILGKTDEDLFPAPDAAYLRHIKQQVLDTGQGTRTEAKLTLRNESFFYDLSIEPLRDAEGQIVGVTCASLDMTERKEHEMQMARAKEQAELANRAKDSFLANMSHELRTPLAAIIGYSELIHEIAEESGYDEISARLEKIDIAAKHLQALISDVLDLSKIEAGKMELYFEVFPLSVLINEVIDTIHPLIEPSKNNLVLNIDIPPKARIYVDGMRLRQVLINLLSNATKFTHEGEVKLSVWQEDDWYIFEIKDTGLGISEEQQKRLFTPFHQVDDSTTRRFGGTGLGLAISKRICEQMNGYITLTSVLGKGSCFTVYLPVNLD